MWALNEKIGIRINIVALGIINKFYLENLFSTVLEVGNLTLRLLFRDIYIVELCSL